MEIRIGISHAARDLAFESKDDQKSVAKAVAAALESGGLLELKDDKGRLHLIPAEKIAYVEIGESTARRVGFGAE